MARRQRLRWGDPRSPPGPGGRGPRHHGRRSAHRRLGSRRHGCRRRRHVATQGSCRHRVGRRPGGRLGPRPRRVGPVGGLRVRSQPTAGAGHHLVRPHPALVGRPGRPGPWAAEADHRTRRGRLGCQCQRRTAAAARRPGDDPAGRRRPPRGRLHARRPRRVRRLPAGAVPADRGTPHRDHVAAVERRDPGRAGPVGDTGGLRRGDGRCRAGRRCERRPVLGHRPRAVDHRRAAHRGGVRQRGRRARRRGDVGVRTFRRSEPQRASRCRRSARRGPRPGTRRGRALGRAVPGVRRPAQQHTVRWHARRPAHLDRTGGGADRLGTARVDYSRARCCEWSNG